MKKIILSGQEMIELIYISIILFLVVIIGILIYFLVQRNKAYNKLEKKLNADEETIQTLYSLVILAGKTEDVISVSVHQLNHLTQKIENSTVSTIKQLDTISTRIDQTVQESGEIIRNIENRLMLGVNEKEENGFSNKITNIQSRYEVLIKDILDELSMIIVRKNEDIKRMEDMEGKILGIYKLANEITKITKITQILALNTQIEAANAGEYGKTFKVIANEVHELAVNTQKTADLINSEIQNTVQSIKNNTNFIKEVINIETNFLNSTVSLLRDVFLSVIQSLIELSNKIENIIDLSNVIKKDLIPVIVDFQFEDITKQMTTHIIQLLQILSKEIQTLQLDKIAIDPKIMEAHKDDLKELIYNLSTMSSERIIAQSVLGKTEETSTTQNQGGEVEFF